MSEALWSSSVLAGIRDRLSSRLADILVLISADGGATVTPPVSFEVRENLDDVSALPFVAVQMNGDLESEFLMPDSFRLHIPVQITSVVAPEANPTDPDLDARTYNRAVVNCLTENATVDDITGLFFVGDIQTRIEAAGEGTRKWRRLSIVEATLYVATTRERT